MKAENKKTYSVAEAAELLGLKPGVIYRMLKLNQLPGAFKLNPYSITRADWVIPQSAIDQVLADRSG